MASPDDVDTAIEKIVRRSLEIVNSFCCPYCAEEYLFEFTLRDHLRKKHKDFLGYGEGKIKTGGLFSCPFCDAEFYLIGLLPKHIGNSHGSQCLQKWQQNDENMKLINTQRDKEPSITYALCSPGLSDVFSFSDEKITICNQDQQQIKSILKKPTVNINKFIHSPSSVSIRRSKNEIIRRTSVRRELRFDLPSQESSSPDKKRKSIKLVSLRNFFKRKKLIRRKTNQSQLFTNIITSTPINLLHSTDNNMVGRYYQKDDSLGGTHDKLPFAFSFEMYQCAMCKEKFSSNRDLLNHSKNAHRKIWYVIRPQYQCGQCGTKYFSNKTLVSHCMTHNTFN